MLGSAPLALAFKGAMVSVHTIPGHNSDSKQKEYQQIRHCIFAIRNSWSRRYDSSLGKCHRSLLSEASTGDPGSRSNGAMGNLKSREGKSSEVDSGGIVNSSKGCEGGRRGKKEPRRDKEIIHTSSLNSGYRRTSS